jgi:hypothetical protein
MPQHIESFNIKPFTSQHTAIHTENPFTYRIHSNKAKHSTQKLINIKANISPTQRGLT